MTARIPRFSLLLLVPLVLLVGGCSEAPVEVAKSGSRVNPLQAAAANAKALSEATELAAAAPATADAVAAAPEADYEPPFPERIDLFAPPKQGARVATQTSGESSDSVVLLGFANLDTPRAVLAINNVIRPISAGEELSGVRVISISPPQAVLQRGRSRWTASIE